MQYGPRIAATAVYLQTAQFLPKDRLAAVMKDLFGAPLCAATLANMTARAAQLWRGFAESVRDLLAYSGERERSFRRNVNAHSDPS